MTLWRHRLVAGLAAGVVVGLISLLGAARPVEASDPGTIHVLILGDSFSAGNGAGDYRAPVGCFRSGSNWSSRYVDQLEAIGYDVVLTNRACSGAVMADITTEKALDPLEHFVYLVGDWTAASQNDVHQELRDNDACPARIAGDEEWSMTFAVGSYSPVSNLTSVDVACQLHVRRQLDAVGGEIDLVLMTIGGNDGNFDAIVPNCFGGILALAVPADCAENVGDATALLINEEPEGFRSRLENVLLAIEEDLPPHAKLALLSYPYLEVGGYVQSSGYAAGDAVRALGDLGDAKAAEAVANVNQHPNVNREFAVLVDSVKAAFAGHEPNGDPWDRNPDRWFHEFIMDSRETKDWYHPNPLGHQGYADALYSFGDFSVEPPLGDPVDIVFVVDSTQSMNDDIDALATDAAGVVSEIQSLTESSRFGLVTYRDDPAHTGDPSDYRSRVDFALSDDSAGFLAALDGVVAAGGGDPSDTVYSGLVGAAGMDWRPGVKRVIIHVGDSAPQDPEAGSGLTNNDVVEAILDAGGAATLFLDVSTSGPIDASLADLASLTGGAIAAAHDPAHVPAGIDTLADHALRIPYAHAGGPYLVARDQPMVLDAIGSHTPDGSIVTYDWDLDGDLIFDLMVSQPTHSTSFAADYDGHAVLRVTDTQGYSSIAATRLLVSEDGDGIPSEYDNCPNVANPAQGDFDGDGVGDRCDPDPGFRMLLGPELCPVSCIKASIWGDPHLVTFDGLAYDLQTAGEHVLIESDDGSIMVQTRHEPWRGSDRVSSVTTLATKLGGYPIEIRGDGSLLIGGEAVELVSGQTIPMVGGAQISREGDRYTLGWPGDGDQRLRIDVSWRKGYLDITPHLPEPLAGTVTGLLGDADGDPSNDLTLRDGTMLAQPISSTTLYGPYANSWRITGEESLFTYEAGQSTQDYTDVSFPSGVTTIADLDPNDRAWAETICAAAGVTDPIILEACVLDVALTGESDFAQSALGVPTPASAITGGFYDDFEDGTADGWSSPVVTAVENGSTMFMGPNGAVANALTITDLPPHTEALVSFDLHVVGGWDGDDGPDAIRVEFGDGTTILAESTFSNTSATQSYPTSGSASKDGAATVDDLGSYGGFGSATYHFETTIDHYQDTLTVDFAGIGNSPAEGEFWGVDNVSVQLVRLLPDRFDVDPDLRIPDDVAGPGAGNLGHPGSEDHYRFTIAPGFQGIHVNALSCVSGGRFDIVDDTGASVLERSCGDFELDLAPGDYTLAVRSSSAATGSYSLDLHAVPGDIEGQVIPGGSAVTVVTATPGQNANVTFDAAAGDRVSMKTSQSGYGSGQLTVRVYAPSGTQVWSNTGFGTSVYFDVTALPETGTYTILLNPEGAATGSSTTTLWAVPPDVEATTTVGSSVTAATGTPGQNANITFEATQNDSLTLGVTQTGYGSLNLTVRVYAPSGTQIWSTTGFGSSKTFGPTTMPETGTYTIELHPEGSNTGSATVTITAN